MRYPGSNPIRNSVVTLIIWRSDNKTLDVNIEVVYIICRSPSIIKFVVVSYSNCLFFIIIIQDRVETSALIKPRDTVSSDNLQ